MKCSTCNAPILPVLAVDIDGTLGDYHGHFLEFAEGWLGVPGARIWAREPYTGAPSPTRGLHESTNFGDWFCYTYNMDRSIYRQIKLAYRQGGQKRTMPVHGGAADCLKLMSFAEIWLTTTRPYQRLDGVDPDTRAWLAFNKIPYNHLIYDHDKYALLAEQVGAQRVMAVVDDLPELYDEAARIFGADVPILKKSRWNRDVERPKEALNWQDVHALLKHQYREWRKKNA